MRRVSLIVGGLVVAAAAGVFAYGALASGEVIQLEPAQASAVHHQLVSAAERDESIIGGPHTFCHVDVGGYDRVPAAGAETTAWAFASCTELIPQSSGMLSVGAGMEVPVRFTLTGPPEAIEVVGATQPEEIDYSDSINALFPAGPARDVAYATPDFADCELVVAARKRYNLPGAKVVGKGKSSGDYADCS